MIVLVLHGCRDDDAAVRRQADSAFTKAKQAMARGDHRESRRLLSQTVVLDRRLENNSRLAETSLLLGANYSSAAEFDSALYFFRSAKALYAGLADKPGMQASTLAIAAVHSVRCENRKAYGVLNDALRLEEALGESESVRAFKWALVPVSRSLGDPETEQRLLKELLSDYSAERNAVQTAKVYVEYGISSLHRHDFPRAIEHFQSAVTFANQGNDSLLVIEALQRLAMAYERERKIDDAFRMYSQALQRTDITRGAEQLRVEMLLRVGNVYLLQQQYAEARKFYNVALRTAAGLGNSLAEAYALLQLGHCMSEMPGGLSEARIDYTSAAALLEHVGLPSALAYAKLCLGALAMKSGTVNEALTSMRSAAALRDSSFVERNECDVYVECEGVFARLQPPADVLADMLLETGNNDEALLYARRKNCRALFDVFSRLEIRTRDTGLNSALSHLAELRGNYLGAEGRLAEAFTTRSDSPALAADVKRSLATTATLLFEKADSIQSTNKQYHRVLFPSEASQLEVRRFLPEGSTLVEYVAGRRSLYSFISSAEASTVQISAIERPALFALMNEYLIVLQQRNDQDDSHAIIALNRRIKELSSRLYSAFLRPVEANVRPGTTLFIVLPSDFPLIPLHALQKEGLGWMYAIELFSFRYLPYVEALTLSGARMNTSPAVVTFGNRGGTSWDVEYELRNIGGFFKDVRQYFNANATVDQLRRTSGDILHAALDIHYLDQKPENSFIKLAVAESYATVGYVRFGEMFGVAPFSTVILSNLNKEPLRSSVPCILLMNGSVDVVMNSFVPLRKTKKIFNETFCTSIRSGNSTEVSYRKAMLALMKNPDTLSPALWGMYFLW